MTFIQDNDGKPQILKKEALIDILGGKIPTGSERFGEILDRLDSGVRTVAPKVTPQALSNAHGDWYEWLLAIICWNMAAADKNLNLALLLPNKSSLDLATMYSESLREMISDLRNKVEATAGVQLVSSNPDFVFIKRQLVDQVIGEISPIGSIDIGSIDLISSTYRSLVGQCSFEDILGYISVKTSFRPDRRLQIPHEGSLMKALYVHLQTRNWILNPPGLKFYAMATKVGPSDRESLKTVATHSITTVSSIPEPAVDEVYEVSDVATAVQAFGAILKSTI